MRLPHSEHPAPALDSSTFLALLRQRAKAVPNGPEETSRPAAQEQSEESQPAPACSAQAAAAVAGPDKPALRQRMGNGTCSKKQLEAKRVEAAAKRQQAASQLLQQQQQLAEAQERLEKLNEDKHELVIQLKQALQQEVSLKRLATQGSLLSPRAGTPRLTTATSTGLLPEVGAQAPLDSAPQPLQSAMPPAAHATTAASMAGLMTAPPQPAQQAPPSQLQEHSMQGARQDRREGRFRAGGPWANEDEDSMVEEGEVIASPSGHAWAHPNNVLPSMGRGAWLPPHLQFPGMAPRLSSWQPPNMPGGVSQLPPHLSRQNTNSFAQPGSGAGLVPGPGMQHGPAGVMQGGRGRMGQGPPVPGWGGREGGGLGTWQHGNHLAGQSGMFGRRAPYPYQ